MLRLPIDSSVIAAMGYDPASAVLEIEFRTSGYVYRYFGVPAGEYRAFLEASSKGAYLDEHFKKAGYRYKRLS